MRRHSLEIPDQRSLWDYQHATRGMSIEGSDALKFRPNTSAVELNQHLKAGSTVVEVGSANGRDARYLASHGHEVFAIDFSKVALDQLLQLSKEQGVSTMITAILWDVGSGSLPIDSLPGTFDAFYARSALHINDTAIHTLFRQVDKRLTEGGVVAVEGKGPNDTKIARSAVVERNLVVDHEEGGHLRRVWRCEFARRLCDSMRWFVLKLKDRREKWNGTPATFMTLLAQKGQVR